jgi:glyoxylase-like metal-dependent hydrolase (beta-lactamase superfamily II)
VASSPVPGGLGDAAPATFVAPDVVRVGLDTGSPEGENVAYVLPKLGVVVDPGPPTDAAWDRLVDGIEATGLAVDDVALVLLTHWHADHAGLGPRLAEAADATLAMHEADAPLVADYAAERERRLDRDAARLRAWGVPDDRVRAIREADRPSPMPDSYPVRELSEGERVLGLKVLHVPGHTFGGAAYLLDDGTRSASDGSRRDGPLLFVGDHALPTYTPNVGGGDSRLFGTDHGRDPAGTDLDHPDPLMVYLDALDRLVRVVEADGGAGESEAAGEKRGAGNGLQRGGGHGRAGTDEGAPDDDPSIAGDGANAGYERNGEGGEGSVHRGLPGHGAPFDLDARADEITEHHRARRERVAGIVAETDSERGVTPWAVARELFGEMDGIHAKMGAGEAAAHLAALRACGEAEVVDEGPLRYGPPE